MVKRYEMKRDHMADCFCEIDEGERGEYVRGDDYDALAARLAEEQDRHTDTASELTLALKRLAELEAVHAVVCKEVHDGELNECRLEARLAEATQEAIDSERDYQMTRRKLAEAVAAVQASADHYGPLEDNHMLNDDCRHCFALARAVLSPADSATAQETNSHG